MKFRREPRYAVGDLVTCNGLVWKVKQVLPRKTKCRHVAPAYLLIREYHPRKKTLILKGSESIRKVPGRNTLK